MEFKSKNRFFRHIRDGWCARQIDKTNRETTVWRMFWGPVQPGSIRPTYVTAQFCDEGDFIEFDTFEEAVEWVNSRGGQR